MKRLKLLMSTPTYFNVIHQMLNPHMTMKQPVNKAKSLIQWNNLKMQVQKQNCEISIAPPAEGLVDLVFTANAGLKVSNVILLANFKAEPRRPESKVMGAYFRDHGYDVREVEGYFEGEGDALYTHSNRILWVGYGFRTESKVIPELRKKVKEIDPSITVKPLQLVKPHFYHLDTSFCPLTDNKLLLNPDAFKKEDLEEIYKNFAENEIIEMTSEEAMDFSCNSLCVARPAPKRPVLIGNKYSERLRDQLDKHGFETIECEMSQFILAGGACKCCFMTI